MFDQFRYGAGAGGGARKQGWAASQPARLPQRSSDDRLVDPQETPQLFVIGANETTLAVIASLRAENSPDVAATLVPLARTPAGVVIGEGRQVASVPLHGLFDWIDRTFPPDDQHAFVASVRDLELLARVGWHSRVPDVIDESSVINIEDLPDEIADALAGQPVALVQCATCRRLCVRDDFIWKEKQLCAWDFHAQAFGKRGPWHQGAYEDRRFDTLPRCAYVARSLLAELGVEAVLSVAGLDEATSRTMINALLTNEPARAHMAVRSADGVWVLREG